MSTTKPRASLSVLLGAAFLMATSAIGPGFLTQTVVFTDRIGASFGFAILLSVLFDLGAQLNIWRIIVASGRPAQEVADDVLRGLGTVLAVLVALGGLAFNIGNVAGAGLGLEAMLGVPTAVGAVLSAAIAVALFLVKEAGRAMDRFAQIMGFLMVALTAYVAVASHPPYGEALLRSVVPVRLDPMSVVTIVGGTVGGYITFAGGHRLLDAGVRGPERVAEATRAATSGILIASVMRVLLFLGALGIVSQGLALDPANPPASMFRLATGEIGYRLFGVVMWAAAVTSVVGSAYTSITFLRSLSGAIDRSWRATIVVFILVSTAIFLAVGRPVAVLLLVGALNALILPISLGAMLVAAYRPKVARSYRHPVWLALLGAVVVVAMAGLGAWTMATDIPKLFQ